MDETTYRVAQRVDYGDLAEWLVQMSQRPEQHCLHSWAGETVPGLWQDLAGYWDDSELCYILGLQAGRLVGAMGSEYDEELRRGWLHGPHVAVDDWEGMAQHLYTRVLAELPAGIGRVDAYLNVKNVRGRRFYAGQGFQERAGLSYDFWLEPGDRLDSGQGTCAKLDKVHEASFIPLFESLFPNAYYSAERVIGMVGQSHRVLVAAEGDRVLGFVVASVEGDRSPGEVQFLGVREDCRRRGHGRALLLSAVDWLLDHAGVPRVSLNVNEELAHARELYESVGFRLRFTGIGLHKNLSR